MSTFELGQLYITQGIANDMEEDLQFAKDVVSALARYTKADFSDMEYEDDIKQNLESIKSNSGRIFASYKTSLGKIFIITEHDRSVTTILYPDEY